MINITCGLPRDCNQQWTMSMQQYVSYIEYVALNQHVVLGTGKLRLFNGAGKLKDKWLI